MTYDEKAAIEYANSALNGVSTISGLALLGDQEVKDSYFELLKTSFLAGRKGEARRGAHKMASICDKIMYDLDGEHFYAPDIWLEWEKEEHEPTR